jgi:hypothetical protein
MTCLILWISAADVDADGLGATARRGEQRDARDCDPGGPLSCSHASDPTSAPQRRPEIRLSRRGRQLGGVTEYRWHVPHRSRLGERSIAQGWRLATDDQQVVCRRVGAESRAMVFEECSCRSKVSVVRQHGQRIELRVRGRRRSAGLLGVQPLRIRRPIVGLVTSRRVWCRRPVVGDVGTPRTHAAEVAIGRVVPGRTPRRG